MRELKIDFADTRRLPRSVTLALLAVSLALAATAVDAYRDARAALDYWHDEVAQRQAASSRAARTPAPARGVDKSAAAELAQAHEIAAQLALPWDPLFRAVEAATPADIALLGVEPNAQKRNLRLVGEGKDIHAVLGYVRQLEAQPLLRDVYLLDHGTSDADPQRPARFVIEAAWGSGS